MTSRVIAFGILFTFLAMAAMFPMGCSQTPSPAPSQTQPVATDTVTITPTKPSPTPEATTATPAGPGKSSDIAPYSLSKGRRDPFVPFGGAMPDNTTPQPAPTQKVQPKPVQSGQPMPQAGEQKAAPPASVPVVVTGTFISGGKNFAIVQGETGGPSFMVTTGDKVGEYNVKSVTAQRVVLTWSGKDYVVKMRTMDNPMKGGGGAAPAKGGESQQKSLPAPSQPQAPGGTQGGAPGGGAPPQQMGPPPGGGNQGGSGAPGGTGSGAPGGGPPKTDGSKPK